MSIESEAVDSQVEHLKTTKIVDDVRTQLRKDDPTIDPRANPAGGAFGGVLA